MPARNPPTAELGIEKDATIRVDRANCLEQEVFRLKVGSQYRAFEHSEARTSRYILGAGLVGRIPGFSQQVPTILKMHIVEKNREVYSYHRGGNTWAPTIPSCLLRRGDVFTASVLIPCEEDFVKNLPPLSLVNELGMRWMADTVN
jgi:hypothetical protein